MVVAPHGMDAVGVCACARLRRAAHTRWHAGVAGCAVQRLPRGAAVVAVACARWWHRTAWTQWACARVHGCAARRTRGGMRAWPAVLCSGCRGVPPSWRWRTHGGGAARHGRSGRVRVCTAARRGAQAVACGRGRLRCAAAAAGCRRRGGGVRTVVARHGMDAVGVCAWARLRGAAHTRWHAGVAGCAVQRLPRGAAVVAVACARWWRGTAWTQWVCAHVHGGAARRTRGGMRAWPAALCSGVVVVRHGVDALRYRLKLLDNRFNLLCINTTRPSARKLEATADESG